MGDRPIECSHCKKPAKIVYKEIAGGTIVTTDMCSDCPILQEKLHREEKNKSPGSDTALYCDNCRTSLDAVKMGNPLGCSVCYTVFADVLVTELMEAELIPPQLQKIVAAKKTQPLHIGKAPNKPFVVIPSTRLNELNEALNVAVKRENYEQAAYLRDQIKALMEHPDDGKK